MFYKQLLHSSTVRLSLIALMLSLGVLSGSQFTGQAEAAPSQTTATQPDDEARYQIFLPLVRR